MFWLKIRQMQAGETAQWVNCVLHMHKQFGYQETMQKPAVVAYAYNPSTVRGGANTCIWGLSDQSVYTKHQVNERLYLKNQGGEQQVEEDP